MAQCSVLYETWLLLPAARLYGFLNQQRGQTLAEYGLLLTLIAVGVVLASMLVFRNQLVAGFGSATNCLTGSC